MPSHGARIIQLALFSGFGNIFALPGKAKYVFYFIAPVEIEKEGKQTHPHRPHRAWASVVSDFIYYF
jgi:hypothetical protein